MCVSAIVWLPMVTHENKWQWAAEGPLRNGWQDMLTNRRSRGDRGW